MSDNKSLEADRILVKKLFGVDPLKWYRREDGSLVYLNQAGQKFIIPPDQLDQKIDAHLDKIDRKPGLNPAKQVHPEPVERVRTELVNKPAGVPPAPQVVTGAPPVGGADAPTPAVDE